MEVATDGTAGGEGQGPASVPGKAVAGHAVGEVDGVRVLWSTVPGPLRACLLFSVGQAHERLPTHGLTHLVEHLVLSERPEGPHAYNGATGLVTTSFVVGGLEDDVVAHLGHVCRSLADLPTGRLEHERGVMRSEAAQRAASRAADALLTWRFGAQGFGLPAFEELALRWAGAEEVSTWSRRFAADNALLWLSAPPPAGLRLPLRPVAEQVHRPALSFAGTPLPGAFPYQGGGVAFSVVMPRAPQVGPLMWLLHARLHARLRDDLGLSYGPQSATEVLDAEHRLVQVLVPCLPENAGPVTAAVCAELEALATQPASEQEWSRMTAQRQLAASSRDDNDRLAHLDNSARLLLLGGSPEPMEDFERRVDAVTRDEVRTVTQQVLPSLLVGTPAGDEVPERLARRLSAWSTDRVSGRSYSPTPHHPDREVSSLVVGDDGVSLVRKNGELATVRYRDVVGALVFDEGTRTVVSAEGVVVQVSPEQWVAGGWAAAAVDAQLPQHVRIPSGPRTPSGPVEAASGQQAHPFSPFLLLLSVIPFIGLLAVLLLISGHFERIWPGPRRFQVAVLVALVVAVASTMARLVAMIPSG